MNYYKNQKIKEFKSAVSELSHKDLYEQLMNNLCNNWEDECCCAESQCEKQCTCFECMEKEL